MKSLKDKRDEERKIKEIKRKTLKEENRQKKANSIESVRGRSCVKSEKKGSLSSCNQRRELIQLSLRI